MTLKEFSELYLPLPDSDDIDYNDWRKVFPTELRVRVEYKDRLLFGLKKVETVEEQWERIHKGEVIDREWRALEEEVIDYDPVYER